VAKGRLLKVLMLGGLFGFIGGLLFAPQKGEKSREKLKDALEKGKAKFDQLKEEYGKKEKE
jgi:gas vesicle protein